MRSTLSYCAPAGRCTHASAAKPSTDSTVAIADRNGEEPAQIQRELHQTSPQACLLCLRLPQSILQQALSTKLF
jgi:hypothetical protein